MLLNCCSSILLQKKSLKSMLICHINNENEVTESFIEDLIAALDEKTKEKRFAKAGFCFVNYLANPKAHIELLIKSEALDRSGNK